VDHARPARASADAAGPAELPAWAAAALIAVAVLFAYAPALDGRLLWDDDAHVTRPDLRTLAGLGRIWTEVGATQQYYPLLHTAFWLEHRLWGDAVLGYHLVNVFLHAAVAALLLAILRRLGVPGAALAAALFALHPVHVESVAWISEQKNTLSTVFLLASLYVYLKFEEDRRPRTYALAFVLFVCGLLTKTVVATLPAVLLVLRWWRHGRLSARRDLLPLAPWLAVGAAAGLVTAWVERRLIGAEGADFALTLLERTLLAARVAWFYLGTLAWPVDLVFIYPRWRVDAFAAVPWLILLAAAAVLGVAVLVRRRSRAPLTVALLYLGTLFPVLGFLNVYPFVYSYVADHFAYVPSLAVVAAASALLTVAARQLPQTWRGLARVAALVLLGALAVATWRQSRLYADPRTLYTVTLERNPGCFLCLNNLGLIAFDEGRVDDAIAQYQRALAVKPDHGEIHNNLGNALFQKGRLPEALAHFEEAVRRAPTYVFAHNNLANALAFAGRLDEAKGHYETALQLRPDYEDARRNLAIVEGLRARRAGRGEASPTSTK
jgi:Flp pilus assembly protein TadD